MLYHENFDVIVSVADTQERKPRSHLHAQDKKRFSLPITSIH